MVFLNEVIIQRIKKLIKEDQKMKLGWEQFEASMQKMDNNYADDSLKTSAYLKESNNKYRGVNVSMYNSHLRKLSEEARDLAFYSLITGEKDYIYVVRDLILNICNCKVWCFQGIGNGWRSDIWTADVGANLAVTLDIISDSIEQADLFFFRKTLYEKSFIPLYEEWVDPEKRIHALDTMGHNWWSVCVSGAGIMLLALGYGTERYNERLEAIVSGLVEWFNYPGNVLQNKSRNFGEQGDFIEHVGYLEYALASFSIFESSYRKLTGDERFLKMGILQKIPDFYLSGVKFLKEGVALADFGDTKRAGCGHVCLYLAKVAQRRDMVRCFLDFNGKPANGYEFLFYPGEVASVAYNLPEMKIFNYTGYAVVRNEAIDMYFAMKTGESWNHNHLDVGTFMLSFQGRDLLIDSGTCAYSNPLYAKYYTKPLAHNLILYGGEGQWKKSGYTGTKFKGGFPVVLNTPGYKYLLADCTGPYNHIYQRFYRHVVFMDGIILMVDDLFAYDDENEMYEWLLHPAGDTEMAGDRVRIHNNEVALDIWHLFPEEKEFVNDSGYMPEKNDPNTGEKVNPKVNFLKIRAVSRDRKIKFLTVFVLPDPSQQVISVEKKGNREVHAVILKYNEGSVNPASKTGTFYCNLLADGRIMHRNSHICFEKLQTDAFLTYMETDDQGEITRIGIHNGSYLKYRNICYFSCLQKSDICIDYTKNSQMEFCAVVSADVTCHVYTGEKKGLCGVKLVKGDNRIGIL